MTSLALVISINPPLCRQNEMFNELARIFSDANNMLNQRELLMKEGTAKHAEAFGENDKHLQKYLSRSGANHTVRSDASVTHDRANKPALI